MPKCRSGGHTVAVLDRTSGDLWVLGADEIAGFDIKGSEPVVELGKNADATVGQNGTVYAVSAKNSAIVTIPVDDQGNAGDPSTASVDGLDKDSTPTITAVGDVPVILDAKSGLVASTRGLHEKIDGGEDAVLQQASASTDSVAIATATTLLAAPLGGGDIVETQAGGSGSPAAPVFLNGCTYAAWGGSARFIRDCAGERSDVAEKIPGGEKSTRLTFRVNRDVIVLNDVIGGEAWLADDSLQRVDDWSILTPPRASPRTPTNRPRRRWSPLSPSARRRTLLPSQRTIGSACVRAVRRFFRYWTTTTTPTATCWWLPWWGRSHRSVRCSRSSTGGALQIMAPEDATGTARIPVPGR